MQVGPKAETRHSGWLSKLLDQTENASSLVANSIMITVIVLSSVTSSLLLALVLPPLLGWPAPEGFLQIVGLISFFVPLLVGLPAILFSDALITRIKRMRRKLGDALTQAQLANRAKTEFLANMSHEIRTPLNGVLGMAQVLEATSLTAEQRAHLATIRDSGDLLMRVIDDVLDLARIEAGRIDLHPAPAPLGAALAATVQLFAARAAERNTRLEISLDPELPDMVVHDSVRVRQVLANLVSNAVKFTTDGQVTVTCSAEYVAEGDWLIHISVQDSGIGIPLEAETKLFQAFAQADSSTGRTHGGTGLGLAIARRLARAMGGDITLTSTPGDGTTFDFSFRARAVTDTPDQPEPAETSDGPDKETETALKGLRVLVVDDSAVNRKVVAGLLTRFAVHCIEAEGGAQALALLERESVDVILLDIHMPGMDGPTTLQKLRDRPAPWSQLPVIALTADVMRNVPAEFAGLGMQGYLSKPIRLTELCRAIHDAAAAPSLHNPDRTAAD